MAEENILDLLHKDHEEAARLIDRIIAEADRGERARLFNQLRDELTAHLEAEAKVLYARLEKQDENSEGHHFALEGTVEHELVEEQLAVLGKSRNKEAEDWTARMEVVKEMVKHHVEEEESEGHAAARAVFDEPTLLELGDQFTAEKERMLRSGVPKRVARAHAGNKPQARTKTGGRSRAGGRTSRR